MPQPDQSDQDRQPLPATVTDEILRYQSKLRRAERLLETANDAARAVQVPFTTFILLGTYIGIIIASTTDEQLLRISPVTLPLLDVELPILRFYLFAPWLFVLLHFNLLLYLALLERQLRLFEQFVTELPEAEATVLRQRLYNFPFVHMLIGRQYDRFMRLVLALIVWITVIALPLGLLLWAQIAFLPYHDPYITWGQRAAVVLDAAILVLFWSRIVSTKSAMAWWRQRLKRAWTWLAWLLALPWAVLRRALRLSGKPLPKPWAASRAAQREGSGGGAGFLLLTVVTAVLGSLLIATVPEERWEQSLVARLPSAWIYHDEVNQRRFFRPTYALFEAEGAVLSRNLTLREQVLTVNALPAEVINILREGEAEEQQRVLGQVLGINLQGRDLRYARLSKSILPKADLRGAELQAADLRDAQLQGANLAGAQLQSVELAGARLQGANLRWAELQSADLRWAQLQGADLAEAQMQGADLDGAQMQGTDLRRAQIGGTSFQQAHLDLADLRGIDRTAPTEEQYEVLRKTLDWQVNDVELRARILQRFEAAIKGQEIGLDAVSITQPCLSDAPALPGCVTEEQPQREALRSYLVTLACSDRYAARGVAQRVLNDRDSEMSLALLDASCPPLVEIPEAIKDQLGELASLPALLP